MNSDFDPDWYATFYPDILSFSAGPQEHFRLHGKAEGRHPTKSAYEAALGFNRDWYLAAYPDVADSELDPFDHYLAHGKKEGRHCNENFSFSPSQLAVLEKSYHCPRGPKALSSPSSQTNEIQDYSFSSARYWSDRYRDGGNSGAGSYGRLAAFKANTINSFVLENKINSVIEFGCGDGAQLALAEYPSYLGFDVADTSIEICRSKFEQDETKKFLNSSAYNHERADLSLSLDVIFHLIEDEIFHEYMRRLFLSANRYVIIYSSNQNLDWPAAHVMHRKFSDWIDIYHADFQLIRYIPNPYPLNDDPQNESFADFYIYEKRPRKRHSLPGQLVVSLTSYAKRFATLELTLRRILQQSVQADETILWVSKQDRDQIPQGVLALQQCGLSIRITEDLRSYKKIIPALRAYPESFIITLDDDTAYPLDVIEPLVANYRRSDEVLCRRAHRVTFGENGEVLPYNRWQFETQDEESSPNLFPTGVGGVLYPPCSLHSDALEQPIFTALAPFNDDLWLYWMEWLAGSTVRRVGASYLVQPWPGCHEQGLWASHNSAGGNDKAILALTARYGSPFSADHAPPPERYAYSSQGSIFKRFAWSNPSGMPIELTSQYKPMSFRRLIRPLVKPIMREFARLFATRSEYEEAIALLRESAVRNEESVASATRELAALAASLRESKASIDVTLDQESEEISANERQIAAAEQQIAANERQIAAAEQQIAANERQIAAAEQQIAANELRIVVQESRLEELKSTTTSQLLALDTRTGEVERAAAFDRQAIFDLGRKVLNSRGGHAKARSGVGVIVPTCDRPELLESALESIAAQTLTPEVVILVNDGQEEVTDVIQRFVNRLRMVLLKTPSPFSGSSVARNVALDAVNTPWVAFLDDDNLMWPGWIERVSSILDEDPSLNLVYGVQLREAEFSVTDKTWFLAPFDFERLQKSNFIDINQVVHRSSSVRFEPSLRRLVDWDYLIRVVEQSPGRTSPVNAISSIYSSNGPARITVAHWPPALSEVVANRRRGHAMEVPDGHHACSCCGFVGEFLPGPRQRPDAGCPHCGSLERHRFLQLVAPLLRALWIPQTRPRDTTAMIEIAPSHATRSFRRMFGSATTVDADPAADGRVVNVVASLTDLPMRSESCDVVLALHVFEHIPEDRKAMSEVARVLLPTGIGIVQVPLSGRATTDDDVLESPTERLERYGQEDHVRFYGFDFFDRLNSAGLTCISVSPRQSMPPETILKYGLIADEALVFVVRSDSAWATDRLMALESMMRKGCL